MFDLLSCGKAPDGNKEYSYLTMVSQPGLMFGIINIVGKYVFIWNLEAVVSGTV